MRANESMRLIRKLHSPDSKRVLQAVEELRARGWLSDGSLNGMSLQYVHLEGADLYRASLQGADLQHAYLDGANLSLADLQGANLSNASLRAADLSQANLAGAILYKANLHGARNLSAEQLSQASRLRSAVMPDGSRYDGRFSLPGDLALAETDNVDTRSAYAMAEYYGVSPETYKRGQALGRRARPGAGSIPAGAGEMKRA